jgi:hypothetical protein
MAFWRASRDLRWVLGVALAIRFFHSDAPLLGTNSWRECDNASIARNFAAHGMQFMRPAVDWGGVGSPPGGVVQMEFPAYQFSVACLYRVLGEHDWLGRWLSILCSLLAIVCLHGLVAGVASPRAAAWAAFFFAILPLNAYYGRAFMVETPMLAALIGGVWAFDRWLERGSLPAFWLAALGIALGCLLKIVSLYIGLPLVGGGWSGVPRSGVSPCSCWPPSCGGTVGPAPSWRSRGSRSWATGGTGPTSGATGVSWARSGTGTGSSSSVSRAST